jgi:hypothetical protein
VQKFSKNPDHLEFFQAPEGWHEANSITKDQQILGTTTKNLVAQETWHAMYVETSEQLQYMVLTKP